MERKYFFDKNNPDIKHNSPCSGEIESIDYGAKRKVLSINIKKNDVEYNQEELKTEKSLFEVSSINNLSSSSTKLL